MKASTKLERQIERIHRLLEADGTEVVWNDHVPDPDNETQPRQIDVSIRRDGHFTMAECRLHKEPQDVQWIEELIGRRVSLKADAVIAVSSSGFTCGAIKKANAHGIILRTFETLTDQEIKNWGREIGVHLSLYQFMECGFDLTVLEPPCMPVKLSAPDGSSLNLVPLFGLVMDRLEENQSTEGAYQVDVEVEAGILVSDLLPSRALFSAKVECTARALKSVAVVGYFAPGEEDASSYAVVRKYDSESIEITDSTGELGVVVDLSGAGLRPNEYVRAVTFDFGAVRDTKWFQVIGVDDMTFNGSIRRTVRWPGGLT